MTTRRGSQYSIQSDGAGLRSSIDPSRGKRKGKIPSGTESTQGSALSQRQVPEMPMISEPELELSMSNSNRYKSHSEGSDRHLHESVQTVLHSLQGQGLGNFATNTTKSDKLMEHPQKAPQRIKEYHAKKKEATKEEAPVASTRNPQENPFPQERKKNKKKNWRKPYSPSYRSSKIQKDAIDNVFKMARTSMEFKNKEEQRMRQPDFPKK
ncbi:hypothetical protein O181_108896 [Austropuccinia psidii MF-1]|uniref:Uncharacterized protein n=1 Tax=Austropuccinia psidii MF-1 TaxID=1389203 RepID=A0A9Q3PQE7_9BASI|nr:hypothetical protein [Austropuccinia psidii MF-1]